MKKLKSLAAVLSLLFISFGFTTASQWQMYEVGDFKAKFPSKPTYETQVVNSAVGNLTMHIHTYQDTTGKLDDNIVYGIITTEYPDSIIDSNNPELLANMYRSAIDGAVANVNGKLLSETSITLAGKHGGKEVKVDYGEGMAIIRMRLFIVKNKMYILQVITLTEKDNNASINEFLNSFQLK
jgi:hypothetical protein